MMNPEQGKMKTKNYCINLSLIMEIEPQFPQKQRLVSHSFSLSAFSIEPENYGSDKPG
jgi:hypothetical protein